MAPGEDLLVGCRLDLDDSDSSTTRWPRQSSVRTWDSKDFSETTPESGGTPLGSRAALNAEPGT